MQSSDAFQVEAATPEALLAHLRDLAKDDRQQAVVEVATRALPSIQAREANAADAETCRLTMLALFQLGDWEPGYVWRMRALVRAAASGWLGGVLVLVQTEAFRIQSVANGPTHPSSEDYVVRDAALEILEEMHPYLDLEADHGIPWSSRRFFARIYWEKTGFLHYAARRYAEALRCYEAALTCTGGDERGALKIPGGIALTRYMASSDPEVRAFALAEMRTVLDRCTAADQTELAKIARHNVEAMAAGSNDVRPFEIL